MSDGTFKCHICQLTFVNDGTFIPICLACCDTITEPVGGHNCYEKCEVACEVQSEEDPGYCHHCGSYDHYSHDCITSDLDVWEEVSND